MAINFPNSPTDAQLYVSNNSTWVYNSSKNSWKSVRTSVSSARQTYTATANQTTFSVTGGYIPGNVDVYYNGSKLLNGTDVAVSDGLNVILATGATLGAVVEVVGIKPYTAVGETSVSVRQQFVATANQTIFSINGGYIAGQIDVFYNGAKLYNGSGVNVSSGTDIVLQSPATANALVEVFGMQSQAQTIAGTTPVPVRQIFTATANQSIFTVLGGYTAGQIDVYYNGVKLINGTEVSISSGSNVILTTGASSGAIIEVVGLSAFSYVDALKTSGGTISGNLTIVGNLTATNLSGTLLSNINANNITSGIVNTALLGSGVANTNTYLAGDNTWKSVSSGITTGKAIAMSIVFGG